MRDVGVTFGAAVLVLCALAAPAAATPRGCAGLTAAAGSLPAWATQSRADVIGDSVLSGEGGAIHRFGAAMPGCRFRDRGRPGLSVGAADAFVRADGRRVAPLVIVGVGYLSDWERHRKRFGHWARRFDDQALRLVHTLHRLGAKQIVWVTLRRPTTRTTPRKYWWQIWQVAWYFGYANERLRGLDRRQDVALADWAAVSGRAGITRDFIHTNRRGARLLGQTLKRAIRSEARRQGGGA